MGKNLVIDLENVLVIGTGWRVLNPQARELLQRARTDFDKTYLWSLCSLKDVKSTLAETRIITFFDYLIGYEISKDKKTAHNAVWDRKLKTVIRQFPWTRPAKDLTNLGDPAEYVLIDDLFGKKSGVGFPKDRVIYATPFCGQANSDLLDRYKEALKLF